MVSVLKSLAIGAGKRILKTAVLKGLVVLLLGISAVVVYFMQQDEPIKKEDILNATIIHLEESKDISDKFNDLGRADIIKLLNAPKAVDSPDVPVRLETPKSDTTRSDNLGDFDNPINQLP